MIAAITLYAVIKFIHIFAAIIAVGFNASYGIWLARAARESEEYELQVLRGIKVLDDRWANPAYGILLVTGVINVFVGDWSFTTFWIATALGLFAVIAILGLLVYSPTLRRQIDVMQAEGRSETYRKLSDKGRNVGIIMAVIVAVIIFLMVTKPTL